MRGLLLDVEHDEVKIVEANGLEDYYRLMGCNKIEIVERRIRGKYFEVVCDEEGLFQAEPKVSAVDGHGDPMLVGSLIIYGEPGAGGERCSLTDKDIAHLRNSILKVPTIKNPVPHNILCYVEY